MVWVAVSGWRARRVLWERGDGDEEREGWEMRGKGRITSVLCCNLSRTSWEKRTGVSLRGFD